MEKLPCPSTSGNEQGEAGPTDDRWLSTAVAHDVDDRAHAQELGERTGESPAASRERTPVIGPANAFSLNGDNGWTEADMVRRLEGTARFLVLRALPGLPSPDPSCIQTKGIRTGVVVDVETTGLDVLSADILELGMVRFAYDKDTGHNLGELGRFCGFRQPSSPIPPEVTRLTGIDDALVAGREIDGDEVTDFIRDTDVVIAHNARFDRPFVERRWPIFTRSPWACSCVEVPWSKEGYDGAKLGHLLMQAGFFHSAHRALDDAAATLQLLSLPLPTSRRSGLTALLEEARAPSARVWADGAPFEFKDVLKLRGYRWSSGDRGLPRSWYCDLPLSAVDLEVAFLVDVVLRRGMEPKVVPITAYDRYSDRAGVPGRCL